MLVTATPSFTQLDAINGMLLMIKEQPVASVVDIDFTEAYVAKEVLEETTQDILLQGWTFNSLPKVSLPVDANNEVPLPVNTLEVEGVYSDETLIAKDGKLFDVINNSYSFTEAKTVNLVLYFFFNDLPLQIRKYIYKTACKAFEKRFSGAAGVSAWIDEEIVRARAACEQFELRQGKPMMVDNYRHRSLLQTNYNPVNGKIKV